MLPSLYLSGWAWSPFPLCPTTHFQLPCLFRFCLSLLPLLLCPFPVVSMVVWTTKTMFPLLLILPNLKSHLCWMEVDLTIIVNPLTTNPPPTQTSSNSKWEVTVVLKCLLLSQNFVLNFQESQPPRNVPLGQLSTSTTPVINHTSTQDIPPRPLVYPLRSLLHVACLAVSGVNPFLFLP